jgi:UDP-glucose 4-epimerase
MAAACVMARESLAESGIPMRVLVCGGAGYIGSHACVVLAERGHEVVIADSFVNSSPVVLERLARL